jgi:serine/threonine protein phosphatase 1
MRLLYAVGDIHGEYDLLLKALDFVNHSNVGVEKALVFLGDYVDRGPQSRAVIEELIDLTKDPSVYALLGNHEVMLLAAITAREQHSPLANDFRDYAGDPRNGGWQTMLSYADSDEPGAIYGAQVPQAHIDWIRARPLALCFPHHLCVHAGIRPGVPLEEQAEDDLLWIRNEFLLYQKPHPLHIIHGHTVRKEPDLQDNRTGLDVGAPFFGRLAIGVFDIDQPGGPLEVEVVAREC